MALALIVAFGARRRGGAHSAPDDSGNSAARGDMGWGFPRCARLSTFYEFRRFAPCGVGGWGEWGRAAHDDEHEP